SRGRRRERPARPGPGPAEDAGGSQGLLGVAVGPVDLAPPSPVRLAGVRRSSRLRASPSVAKSMLSVVTLVLPVFALILIGYLCRRTNRLGPHAASELNRFVVWLALPALLFSVTANSSWERLWQPGFLLAFGGSALAVFLLALFWRLRQGTAADAQLDALGAAYANTGYVGIPLCILVFGENGLEPALIASLVVVCGIFA